jgi:hypothetical protein
MGVWANGLDPTTVDVAGIAATMRPALYAWMSARIKIFDPKRYATSPENALVLDTGEDGAIIQPLRAPAMVDFGSQPTAIVAIRFQVRDDVTIQPGQTLRGGLVVKVVNGGNAPGLERLTFSLPEAVDSSLMWGRIFEANVVATG